MYDIIILQIHYFISFLSTKQLKRKLIFLSLQFSIFNKFYIPPIVFHSYQMECKLNLQQLILIVSLSRMRFVMSLILNYITQVNSLFKIQIFPLCNTNYGYA